MKSGPIQVVNQIVDYLDKDQFELYLISINEEDRNRSLFELMKQKFHYQYCHIKKIDVILGRYNSLKSAIMKIDPDVIHSTGLVPDYLVNRMFPQKQVVILHSNYKVDYVMRYGKIIGMPLALFHIQIAKRAEKAIACSKSLSEIYKKTNNFEVDYIRNGINYDALDIQPDQVYKKKFGFPCDVKVFIYVASFNKIKNHVFLADSFVKLHEQGKKYQLLFLGDGPSYQECYDIFSQYPYIHFKGRVSNVDDYLCAADYYVSSSMQEGMPVAVLEAMNQGLPCVLSDIDQHKEIYEIDNVIGVLYRQNDFESFVKAIETIIKVDKKIVGSQINHIVYEKFQSVQVSKKYAQIYREVAVKNKKEYI